VAQWALKVAQNSDSSAINTEYRSGKEILSFAFMPPSRLPPPAVAKPVKGPPQTLVSRIEHLHKLLSNLPPSLPDNPPQSLYNFWLDPEILADGGHFSAVNHALEVSFETHLLRLQGRTIIFIERGDRLVALIKLLKLGVKHMSAGERTTFQEAWLFVPEFEIYRSIY
jgi:hypothetical protein